MQITIEGISPYDGVYPFTIDTAPLTTTEWHWIKRHSGYMPLTMEAGIEGGDPTLICAFAVISLYRAGKVVKSDVARVYELLADAPFGSCITFDGGEDEVEQESPTSAPTFSLDDERSDGAKNESAGPSSSEPSGSNQETSPAPTGALT